MEFDIRYIKRIFSRFNIPKLKLEHRAEERKSHFANLLKCIRLSELGMLLLIRTD